MYLIVVFQCIITHGYRHSFKDLFLCKLGIVSFTKNCKLIFYFIFSVPIYSDKSVNFFPQVNLLPLDTYSWILCVCCMFTVLQHNIAYLWYVLLQFFLFIQLFCLVAVRTRRKRKYLSKILINLVYLANTTSQRSDTNCAV